MKESVFSIFIFSASIKILLDRYGYTPPVDITLISGTILLILIIINTRSVNKNFIPSIVILILFYLLIFFSLLYTSSQKYAFEKCLYFGTNIIAFLFPILNYKAFDLNIFFKSTIFLSLIILILYFFGTNVSGEILSDYLVVAQLFQIALVLSILLKVNILKYTAIIVFTAAILLLGARAIMLTSILIPIMLISKLFKVKLKSIAIISVFAFIMIINLQNVLNPLFRYSMDRLFLLSDFTNDASAMERVSQYSFVISKYLNEPSKYLFGYGIGSFGQEYLNQDVRSHPHNILLETIFETGFVGLLLLVAFIFAAFNKFLKANWLDHKDYRIVGIILLLLFTNAMKSSSLDGQRDLFCFVAIFHILNQKYEIERKTSFEYSTLHK